VTASALRDPIPRARQDSPESQCCQPKMVSWPEIDDRIGIARLVWDALQRSQRKRATASGDPVGEEQSSSLPRSSETMYGRRPAASRGRAQPSELSPALYVQALGLSRCLCQAHREQRLCNWIVGEGTQNILVAAGGLIEFTSLEI
jgi:hypothetical protein